VWDCVLQPVRSGATSGDAGAALDDKAVRALRRQVHQAIRKGTQDMETFSFNTYIANLMELNNALLKVKETPILGTREGKAAWDEAIEACCCFSRRPARTSPRSYGRGLAGPIRSINRHGRPGTRRWRRKRGSPWSCRSTARCANKIEVPVDVDEATARSLALQTEGAKRHTEGKTIVKVVVVPGRLVSIVTR